MATPFVDTDFARAVHADVRALVARTLPSRSPLIAGALALLLADDAAPVLALVLRSLHGGDQATALGAALDLIQIGLQRLHVGTDGGASAPGFEQAAAILVGDYLTSGAFKLIAGCADLRVLRVIGDAMTLTCEREAGATLRRTRGTAVDPALLRPLGDAAGRAGALLAGFAPPATELAAAFGQQAAIAHAGLNARAAGAVAHADDPTPRALEEAVRIGRQLLALDGRGAPLELALALQVAAAPAAQARVFQCISSTDKVTSEAIVDHRMVRAVTPASRR